MHVCTYVSIVSLQINQQLHKSAHATLLWVEWLERQLHRQLLSRCHCVKFNDECNFQMKYIHIYIYKKIYCSCIVCWMLESLLQLNQSTYIWRFVCMFVCVWVCVCVCWSTELIFQLLAAATTLSSVLLYLCIYMHSHVYIYIWNFIYVHTYVPMYVYMYTSLWLCLSTKTACRCQEFNVSADISFVVV